MRTGKEILRNKELSWLSFNARLLQEASDDDVPLIERLKFLGIFSSNLDEFFRVRVATLKRLAQLGKSAIQIIGDDPKDILAQILTKVLELQDEFDQIYQQVLTELEKHHIYIVDEKKLNPNQAKFVEHYFRRTVRPALFPIMVTEDQDVPQLNDSSIYLAVSLEQKQGDIPGEYSLIEVPTQKLSRFVILPSVGKRQYIILLDDVIRYSLEDIFAFLHYDTFEAYTIKLTRDAELDFDSDLSESFMRKMAKSLEKRKGGSPVRFVYDAEIPKGMLKYLIKKLDLQDDSGHLIPGGRYHNFKDFMKFPRIGRDSLRYTERPPLPHPAIDARASILECIQQRDLLFHYPYQSFDHVIDFLREASIDPKVRHIKMTLYRVASQSNVINALINASRNGKKVTVVMELQARFDEEANIYWSKVLEDEGVRVIHGVPGLKVHAKMILVNRRVGQTRELYAHLGTGNYHESTARLYSDHGLFTCDPMITAEVQKVFDFVSKNFRRETYRTLFVSPFNTRQRFEKLIQQEIRNAKNGVDAYIVLKLNNLTDPRMIKKLYSASRAGVRVRLMVRGMFSLLPGIPGKSDNIQATGTIDKYLEHTRIMLFANGGEDKIYFSSADWMPRNLDSRLEVTCPINDEMLKAEIRDFLEIHWQDNTKARLLDKHLENKYFKNDKPPFRAQEELHRYFSAYPGTAAISRNGALGVSKPVKEKK